MGHDNGYGNDPQVKKPSPQPRESQTFEFPPSSGMFGTSGEVDSEAPGQTDDRGLVEAVVRSMKDAGEAPFPPSGDKSGLSVGGE